jgi:hypothetical protein
MRQCGAHMVHRQGAQGPVYCQQIGHAVYVDSYGRTQQVD